MKIKSLGIVRAEYLPPLIDAAEFAAERGFAESGDGSSGWEDADDENDLGGF